MTMVDAGVATRIAFKLSIDWSSLSWAH